MLIKKTSHLNFCYTHISSSIHRIFKILVCTPHNTPLIMWGRHKNFKDSMYRNWDMGKTRIQMWGFFYQHPLRTTSSLFLFLSFPGEGEGGWNSWQSLQKGFHNMWQSIVKWRNVPSGKKYFIEIFYRNIL